MVVILAGLIFPIYIQSSSYRSVYKTEFAILILCIINSLPVLLINQPVGHDVVYKKFLSLINNGKISSLILSGTENDEYLPSSAERSFNHFQQSNDSVLVEGGNLSNLNIISQNGTEIYFENNSLQKVQLTINRWFFHEWRCVINGSEQNICSNKNGFLALEIPSGHHFVLLKLHALALRELFNWVSLVSMLVWVIRMLKIIYPMINNNENY